MARDKYKDKYVITKRMEIDNYEYGFFDKYDYGRYGDMGQNMESIYYLLADGWEIVVGWGRQKGDHIVRRPLKKEVEKRENIDRFEMMDL